jgi:hypothetical protein
MVKFFIESLHKAATLFNIKSGFKEIGLYPFQSNIVFQCQFAARALHQEIFSNIKKFDTINCKIITIDDIIS